MPLHKACMHGHLAVTEMLIGKGADTDAKSRNNSTPLHVACMNGHVAIVEMLIDMGAQVETKTSNDGHTPLHDACMSDSVAVAAMLIDKGADIEAKDANNCTSLHLACARSNTSVAEVLLDKGAKIEALTGRHNRTPLALALESLSGARAECITMLVFRGAEAIMAYQSPEVLWHPSDQVSSRWAFGFASSCLEIFMLFVVHVGFPSWLDVKPQVASR
eukprot:TRINITY_DN11478_c0_g1_i5.p2 TRINITY_DN11478_c0_g1~~TRINITY_DN11478_c0_g1_i5.p2  ORF type:complete len:218 (+),score=25.97 TRINITY_DN11478_c0_g1_i5:1349-2002(+)